VADETEQNESSDPGAVEQFAGMALWKKALLAGSIVLMIAGGVMSATSDGGDAPDVAATANREAPVTTAPPSDPTLPSPHGLSSGFTSDDTAVDLPDILKNLPIGERTPGPTDAPPPSSPDAPDTTGNTSGSTTAPAWQPAVFRLGFSFFVAFAIGFALRTFVKLTLLVAGVVLLCVFGLEYAGVLSVNWEAMSGSWDGIAAWLERQTSSFYDFVVGKLPSGAAAAGGLFVGFRR